MRAIASFIGTIWDGVSNLPFLDFGFSVGAFFIAIMFIDISLWVIGRSMRHKNDNNGK